jgi:transposase
VKGDRLRSMLETIPGVGPWTTAIWLAEVGDISREFKHRSKSWKLFTAISRGGQDAERQRYKPWRHGSMR